MPFEGALVAVEGVALEVVLLGVVPVEGAEVAPVEGVEVAPVEGVEVAPVEGVEVAPVDGVTFMKPPCPAVTGTPVPVEGVATFVVPAPDAGMV